MELDDSLEYIRNADESRNGALYSVKRALTAVGTEHSEIKRQSLSLENFNSLINCKFIVDNRISKPLRLVYLIQKTQGSCLGRCISDTLLM